MIPAARRPRAGPPGPARAHCLAVTRSRRRAAEGLRAPSPGPGGGRAESRRSDVVIARPRPARQTVRVAYYGRLSEARAPGPRTARPPGPLPVTHGTTVLRKSRPVTDVIRCRIAGLVH
eukprot:689745-Hanusia_phi.AAC.1